MLRQIRGSFLFCTVQPHLYPLFGILTVIVTEVSFFTKNNDFSISQVLWNYRLHQLDLLSVKIRTSGRRRDKIMIFIKISIFLSNFRLISHRAEKFSTPWLTCDSLLFLKKMILFLLIPVIHLIQPVATWILEKLGRNSTTKELIDEIDAQLKGKLLFRWNLWGNLWFDFLSNFLVKIERKLRKIFRFFSISCSLYGLV